MRPLPQVAELKELLKAKDLPTNGVKQELIDRLLEAGGSAAAAGEPEEEAAEPCAGAKAPPSAPAAKPAEKAAPAPKPAANAEPAAPAAQTAAPTAAAAADEPSRADTQVRAARRLRGSALRGACRRALPART